MDSSEAILKKIFVYQGNPVILESDIAEIYHLPVAELMRRVTSWEYFSPDMLVRIDEDKDTRAAASGSSLGFVFTELGVDILCMIFNEDAFVETNIALLRAMGRYNSMREKISEARRQAVHKPLFGSKAS